MPRSSRSAATSASTRGALSPFLTRKTTLSSTDNLMWHRGTHAVKMGMNMVRRQVQQVVPLYSKDSFTVAGNYSGDSLADFVLGLPSQTQVGISPADVTVSNLRIRDVSGYIQEDWRISSRLTLNLGLR